MIPSFIKAEHTSFGLPKNSSYLCPETTTTTTTNNKQLIPINQGNLNDIIDIIFN